jgi:hypothetical protein
MRTQLQQLLESRFPERLPILSLKKNKISSLEGAVLPSSCTQFDVSANMISTFEAVVFPAGCCPNISDQQLFVLGDQHAAGNRAGTVNADSEEQGSECLFQFSKWMPATSWVASDWLIRRSRLETVTVMRGYSAAAYKKNDPCFSCFVLIDALQLAIGLVYDVLRLVFYKFPLFIYRSCTKVDPLNIPPSKSVVFNGYIYATAHFHDVDGASLVEDGTDLVSLGAGFEVAPGDDNDVAVCNAHAWGSRFLAFADRFTHSNTSLQNDVYASDKGMFCKILCEAFVGT